MLNGISLFLQNKSGSILKTKPQDKCLGGQPRAKETRGPALTSDGSQSATSLSPISGLSFPQSPASGLSWNCSFHGGWDWTILREERERGRVDILFRSQLMHQSQIRPLTHHSGSSPLNCGETLLSKLDPCMSQQKQSDCSLGRQRGYLHLRRGEVRRVSAKPPAVSVLPWTPLGMMGAGLTRASFFWLNPTYWGVRSWWLKAPLSGWNQMFWRVRMLSSLPLEERPTQLKGMHLRAQQRLWSKSAWRSLMTTFSPSGPGQ